MHIVQIAPPWFALPPIGYGGIERVIDDLIEGFVAAGHQVTLFAPGCSRTKARLIPTCPSGYGLDMSPSEKAQIFAETSRFAHRTARLLMDADIVHDHTDYLETGSNAIPTVRTLHGPATTECVDQYLKMSRHGDHFIAISQRQREIFEAASLLATEGTAAVHFDQVIHNPVDVKHAPFYPTAVKEDYVAFLGRCHWEKGPAAAIAVARISGVRLKMAMRVSSEERHYFETEIEPLIEANRDIVEFVGELGGAEKDDLIGKARAVLFTSVWEEPFGLVMTESLARGTPVIAFDRGSAPEVIRHGVTGAICADEAAMVEALPWVMKLDPADCRTDAEVRFDRVALAEQHIELFQRLIDERTATRIQINVLTAVAPAFSGKRQAMVGVANGAE